jgi:hypothetical protein
MVRFSEIFYIIWNQWDRFEYLLFIRVRYFLFFSIWFFRNLAAATYYCTSSFVLLTFQYFLINVTFILISFSKQYSSHRLWFFYMSFLIIHYLPVIIVLNNFIIICILSQNRLIQLIFKILIVVLNFGNELILKVLTLTLASLITIFIYYILGLRRDWWKNF